MSLSSSLKSILISSSIKAACLEEYKFQVGASWWESLKFQEGISLGANKKNKVGYIPQSLLRITNESKI